MLDKLNPVLDGFGTTLLNYALFAAAVGTIVMALVELVKAMFSIRRHFHLYQMRRWIEHDPQAAPAWFSLENAARRARMYFQDPRKGSERWVEFLELLTGGYTSQGAVFEQPIEKLMAQVQAASSMALDFPGRYPNLYEFLTRAHAADAEAWRKAANGNGARTGAEARARLQSLLSRQLDALQTEVHYVWSRGNQFFATAGGATLTLLVIMAADVARTPGQKWLAVAAALLAGLSSPFAKDVVSGLSSFRRGRA